MLTFLLVSSFAIANGAAMTFKHVVLISVDGLHATDVKLYAGMKPDSVMGGLYTSGLVFNNASTAQPSDSFPGLCNIVTGASPKTHGIWYDVSYDRNLVPNTDVNCTGPWGTQVTYDESLDFSLDSLMQEINPSMLPLDPTTCTPVYPHMHIQSNTIFEVAKEAGLYTVWSDKHPAYEIVNGPSGAGVDELFTPEINSLTPALNDDDYTKNIYWTMYYDSIKVAKVNSWITNTTGTPSILGMNFQTVSVCQKGSGGELNLPAYAPDGMGSVTLLPNMVEALDFVDAALGSFMDNLAAMKLTDETLVIITAKHGQSPMDTTLVNKIDDADVTAAISAAVATEPAMLTADDIGLIWLNDAKNTDTIVMALTKQMDALGISQIISGADLKTWGYTDRDVSTDSRVPDIILVTNVGVIYSTGTKIAEHGGFATDDTNVALIVSGTGVVAQMSDVEVETKQIAVTILEALGLDSSKLTGAVAEGTVGLPYL